MPAKNLQFIRQWFYQKGWTPMAFQEAAWNAYFDRKSGLISVPTGAGKTFAAYMAALSEVALAKTTGLQILHLSPLRALTADIEMAMQQPIDDMNLSIRVEKRTGDTNIKTRQKQIKKPPEVLLSTPESLAIMLSDPTAVDRFSDLRMIIIDEWHELLGSKRGVLLELCLARLKKWNPSVQIWGVSATIGNLEQAAQICVGMDRTPTIISAILDREVVLETILPDQMDQLPWSGQLGLRMLPFVLRKLTLDRTTLIFTNTRSQAERWHQAILEAKPEWKEWIAIHHSSIERVEREKIEAKLKEGLLKFVICTSSLDLGIDFSPVEFVIQIGSPKSIARLIQRAGRSSHRPMTPCRLAIVPTHALEIIELKGYRLALQKHIIENREPLPKCYDVLIQHLASCAISGGFIGEEMLAEVRKTSAYKDLTEKEFQDCLLILMQGGKCLIAYPEYRKLTLEGNLYVIRDRKMISRHRMNIGTITSDPHVPVRMLRGKTIGYMEENFLASMTPGDHFLFAGKVLELVQYRELTAYVRLGKKKVINATVWRGSRLPYSAPLGRVLREAMDLPNDPYPEATFLEGISSLQKKFSHLPNQDELLMESLKTREGAHLFVYPFEGKIIHQGLAALIAYRLSRIAPATFTLSSNDYGFELLGRNLVDDTLLTNELFTTDHLEHDVHAILNMNELARADFRDIARICGLVFQGFPGKHKSQRQIQVSSGLLYEVFSKYDPDNILIKQAQNEVLSKQFELEKMRQVLTRLSTTKLVISKPPRLSPFALPLLIERISGHLTTETLSDRIDQIKAYWKKK
jgi:ATP-dependent Lhr-like helicase